MTTESGLPSRGMRRVISEALSVTMLAAIPFIRVPMGRESALNMSPLTRSMEKYTLSRSARILLFSTRENVLTIALPSSSVWYSVSLLQAAAPARSAAAAMLIAMFLVM